MPAKKLSERQIRVVEGLLNNTYTRYCFNYENPSHNENYIHSRQNESLLNRSKTGAMIEKLRETRGFDYEKYMSEFWESEDGRVLIKEAISYIGYFVLSREHIVQVRRPESHGNSGDYWHQDDKEFDYSNAPLFAVIEDQIFHEELHSAFYDDHEKYVKMFEEIKENLTEVNAQKIELDSSYENEIIKNTHSPTDSELSFLDFVMAASNDASPVTYKEVSILELNEICEKERAYNTLTKEDYSQVDEDVNLIKLWFGLSCWVRVHSKMEGMEKYLIIG